MWPGAASPLAPRSRTVERRVALDRHAVPVPALREVIPHRVMLDGAVVPEGHGARLPAEAAVQLGRLHVAEEQLEHRGALRLREPDDARGEPAVHEQRLAPGHGVRPYDG